MKKINKKIINIIPFILWASCLITYNIKGSYVDSNGILIEPFYLIPMSYLFLLIGIIISIVNLIKFSRKKKQL